MNCSHRLGFTKRLLPSSAGNSPWGSRHTGYSGPLSHSQNVRRICRFQRHLWRRLCPFRRHVRRFIHPTYRRRRRTRGSVFSEVVHLCFYSFIPSPPHQASVKSIQTIHLEAVAGMSSPRVGGKSESSLHGMFAFYSPYGPTKTCVLGFVPLPTVIVSVARTMRVMIRVPVPCGPS